MLQELQKITRFKKIHKTSAKHEKHTDKNWFGNVHIVVSSNKIIQGDLKLTLSLLRGYGCSLPHLIS